MNQGRKVIISDSFSSCLSPPAAAGAAAVAAIASSLLVSSSFSGTITPSKRERKEGFILVSCASRGDVDFSQRARVNHHPPIDGRFLSELKPPSPPPPPRSSSSSLPKSHKAVGASC